MFWCYANALATSALTIAGQNYGHKNISRVRKTAYTMIFLFVLGSLSFCLLFNVFNKQLVSLFLNDLDTINLACRMVRVIAYSYITYGMVETVSTICKAIGNAKSIMIIAFITICLVRIVYIIFYPQVNAISPIFAYPLSWIISSMVYTIYFINIKKLKD